MWQRIIVFQERWAQTAETAAAGGQCRGSVSAETEVGLVVRTIYCCEDKEPKIPSPQCPGSVSVVTVLEAEFWVASVA